MTGRATLRAAPAAPAAPPPAPKSAPGAKILVVDDSEEVREVLRELLSRHGYTVVTCPDGESGLVELETAPSTSPWWIWGCPASPASRSPSG